MNPGRILTAALVAGFLASMAVAVWAGEPPIQYDPRNANDKATFVIMYARTADCMRQASLVMLRNGVRQPEVIRGFSTKVCTPPLRGWLLQKESMTEAQADTILDHMARRALDAAQQPPNFIIL